MTLLRHIAPLMLGLILHGRAQADQELGSWLSLEDRLQTRVSSIVEQYDPLAITNVKINLRNVRTSLPGTGITNFSYTPGLGKSQVNAESISEIKISVAFSKMPLPAWIEEQIRRSVEIPQVKVTYDFQQLESGTLEALTLARRQRTVTQLDGISENVLDVFAKGRFWLGTLALLILLTGAGAGLALFFVRHMGASLHTLLEKNIPQRNRDEDLNESSQARALTAQASAQSTEETSEKPDASAGNSDDISELKTNALVALFADCYWCEADGYAAWLWQRLKISKRQQLLKAWALDANYFLHIQRQNPEPKNHHNHPAYLQPLPIEALSSGDLATFILKNPALFTKLSPLRAEHLEISLERRLALMKVPTNTDETELSAPTPKSNLRTLPPATPIGRLSLADEEYLFQNADKVDASLRSSLETLVWLALADPTPRKEVLTRYTAEDLAEAWHGPENVLEAIAAALPEKKRALLMSYTQRIAPQTGSDIYRKLCGEGRRLYEQKHTAETSDPRKRAA